MTRYDPRRNRRGRHFGEDTTPVVSSINPNSGRTSGGTSVTITGKNFRYLGSGAAPTVLFGTTPATSVVVVSPTSITCNTPVVTVAGLYDLTVTIGSQSDTLFRCFTFYASVIHRVIPDFGTFAGGTSVVIKGANFITGSAVKFGGTSATDVTFIDDQTYFAVSPNHAQGFVDVTVTEPGPGATATLRNGFKYTLFTRGQDIRRNPGINIRDVLNNQPNSCSFTIDGQSNTPQVGEQIEIVDSTLYGHKKLVQEYGATGAWRLGELSGSVASDAIGANHGAYVGGVTLGQPGVLSDGNTAARCDGADGTEVQIPNAAIAAINGTTSLTLECFVNPTSLTLPGGFHIFYSFPGQLASFLAVFLSGGVPKFTGQLFVNGAQRGVAGTTTVVVGQWYHVVMTYDGSAIRIYVNGGLEDTEAPVTGPLGLGVDQLWLGGYAVGGNSYSFPGRIDEAAIYPTALTAAQVSQLYASRIGTARDGVLFAGNVQHVEQIYEDLTNQIAWKTTAIDFTFLLNKYRPTGIYEDVCVSDIVKDLVANFAPGFTTEYVQTNLAKVTATFDGSLDFSTCLNQLASAIGGGHWYVDYQQRMHFFHTNTVLIYPGFDPTDPNAPSGIIHLGPGSAMTVTEGAGIPMATSFSIGFYLFWSTFVYDNGVESALSPYSNCVALQGTNIISATGLPIGPAAGSHTCTKRRIYFTYIGPPGIAPIGKACQIDDNSTTAFTFIFAGGTGATPLGAVVAIPASVSLPVRPFVAPPAFDKDGPSASQGAAEIWRPQFPPLFGEHLPMTFTPGPWAFKVTNIYRDGTESLPSRASNTVLLDGVLSARLVNVPLGETINGVDVVARKVYGAFGSAFARTLGEVVGLLQGLQDAGNLGSEVGYGDAVRFGNGPIPDTYGELVEAFGQSDIDRLLAGGFVDPDWSPARTRMWYLINDNTTTGVDVGPGTGEGTPPGSGTGPEIPQWPNPDGPYLENFDLPDRIDSANVDLLRDPPFTQSIDLSQVRNRIYVRGAGTVTTAAVLEGQSTVPVADLSMFQPTGGIVMVGFQKLEYTSLTQPSGVGSIFLKLPMSKVLELGSPVQLFFQADDVGSQEILSAIELDKDGQPTDGIHEYTIVDTSLTTAFQLYMRAYAELELFANPIVTVNYATRDPKTRSGATVSIDLTDPPCKGDFLIQDVTIDQIHDEADELAPRYSVSASSVKFELSDLLLQIITGNFGQGVSFAGIAPPLEVAPTVERDDIDLWIANSPGGVGDFGTALDATTGTAIGTIDADGTWARSSSGGPGTPANFRMNLSIGRSVSDPVFTAPIRTGPDLSSIRYWIGFTEIAGSFQNDDTQSGLDSCAFRFSTVAGDAGWRATVSNGTSQTVGPNTITIAANTVYDLRIVISGDGTSAAFYVNNVLLDTLVTNLPSLTTNLFANVTVISQVAATRYIETLIISVKL